MQPSTHTQPVEADADTTNEVSSSSLLGELMEAEATAEDDILANDADGDKFDLNKLLFQSMAAAEERKKIKEARKALQRTGLEPEKKKELQQLVLEWELKREWDVISDTILFNVQECTNCGHTHKHFMGQFQHQRHKTTAIDRWIRSNSVANKGLPKEVKFDPEYVDMCIYCAQEFGWNPYHSEKVEAFLNEKGEFNQPLILPSG